MLALPSYRILPSLTSNDLDTIMKLRQQLSGENGLLTRLSSFMQAQRSTDQRTMPGTPPPPPPPAVPSVCSLYEALLSGPYHICSTLAANTMLFEFSQAYCTP